MWQTNKHAYVNRSPKDDCETETVLTKRFIEKDDGYSLTREETPKDRCCGDCWIFDLIFCFFCPCCED